MSIVYLYLCPELSWIGMNNVDLKKILKFSSYRKFSCWLLFDELVLTVMLYLTPMNDCIKETQLKLHLSSSFIWLAWNLTTTSSWMYTDAFIPPSTKIKNASSQWKSLVICRLKTLLRSLIEFIFVLYKICSYKYVNLMTFCEVLMMPNHNNVI